MQSFFKKPYPYNSLTTKDLYSNLLIGLFVAFFLLTFQPFGISEWQTNQRFLKLLGFGFISFICPTVFKLILVLCISRSKPEETWTVWKEIVTLIFALLFIAMGNLVYGNFIGIGAYNFTALLYAMIATFLLGIFPVFANVAIKYNRYLALNQKEARQMEHQVKIYQQNLKAESLRTNDQIEETRPEPEQPLSQFKAPKEEEKQLNSTFPEETLILISENEKDKVQLNPDDLMYIESADNYSNIVFFKNGSVSKQLLRASLKRLESQIEAPFIIRCHRSYIINLKYVNTIKGNAQGYKIDFKSVPDYTIPVSRNYGKILLDGLNSLR